MVAEVSLVPLGAGTSLSRYVARSVEIIRSSGLRHQFHAMGTNLEGEWDEIMAVVKRCREALLEMGAERVLVRLTIDDRRDKPGRLADKERAVREKMTAAGGRGETDAGDGD
ncbi:MAG: thiamine-binding protein [Deltaproteobacteria bacterium]|nr:MAG: thiamine-binding protein [Deltaproteobacteria bacterium]